MIWVIISGTSVSVRPVPPFTQHAYQAHPSPFSFKGLILLQCLCGCLFLCICVQVPVVARRGMWSPGAAVVTGGRESLDADAGRWTGVLSKCSLYSWPMSHLSSFKGPHLVTPAPSFLVRLFQGMYLFLFYVHECLPVCTAYYMHAWCAPPPPKKSQKWVQIS